MNTHVERFLYGLLALGMVVGLTLLAARLAMVIAGLGLWVAVVIALCMVAAYILGYMLDQWR